MCVCVGGGGGGVAHLDIAVNLWHACLPVPLGVFLCYGRLVCVYGISWLSSF